jgi:hypothetical protein
MTKGTYPECHKYLKVKDLCRKSVKSLIPNCMPFSLLKTFSETLRKLCTGCVDNIRTDLREIGWYGVDWIDLALDRDHGTEPSGSIKCWKVFE